MKQHKYLLYHIALILTFSSCSSIKLYRGFNYFNGADFYNDSLRLRGTFFGDIKFENNFKKSEIVKPYKQKNLLVYGKSNGEYEVFLFINNRKKMDSIGTALISNDKIKRRVVYEKVEQEKTITILLQSIGNKKSNTTILRDGNTIINSMKLNDLNKNNLTYLSVFNKYKNENNFLYVMNKLKNAPIYESNKNKWVKRQLLTTLLSHDTSNDRYKNLLGNFEKRVKERQQKCVDSVIAENNSFLDSEAIKKILELAKETRILMLNENHWKPNHRILAQKLLSSLKKNGYDYLAIEAVDKQQDSILNIRKYPIKNSGYYTRESYFGLFLREALSLGFRIVGYDDSESNNREKSQAQNIKKIIDADKTAKVFVYAGIDHILENNPANKRMAEYFKELTNINPVTIDQVEIVADTKYEIVLSESKHFLKTEKVNTNVDYFLFNNIIPNLSKLFDREKLSKISFNAPIISNYHNRDLLISVYYQKEYEKHKSNSVPILNKIINIKDNNINLQVFADSKLIIKIVDENNKIVLIKRIESK